TGLMNGSSLDDATYLRIRRAGASYVKIGLRWAAVAPERPTRPADPDDPAYDWSRFDAEVNLALAHGLVPIAMVYAAPRWAMDDSNWARPNATELALFARAAALRYSPPVPGNPVDHPYPGPPTGVRHWQVWNEPNLTYYLRGEREEDRLLSPALYRSMVNNFADAVHAVNPSNVVIAGGTGPFAHRKNTAPLLFMRELLCLGHDLTAKPDCGPVGFDVWGHHPYTYGGPTRHAKRADDVSLGDLREMGRVLRAAVRQGTIASSGSVPFWVDEFSWDSRPPDPEGIPSALHARWVSEAVYRMWKAGVSLVVWQQLVDTKWTGRCGSPYQSGLYFHALEPARARPKRALAAFRFPFVAFRRHGRISVWGRTPWSEPGSVAVERRSAFGWRRVAKLVTDEHGIFSERYRRPWRRGFLRARVGAARSVPFSLAPARDRFFNPFGMRRIGCG
ncbi:MAG: hypothetical protein M3304_12190, partial [Actinomycetota bacterium]|nr:hypothetical protein [Actinomycetota bacterium]